VPFSIDNPDSTAIRSIATADGMVRDLNYKYPRGLDLRPGSKLHRKILTEVLNRARESRSYIKQREETWRALDKNLTSYVDLKKEEQRVQQDDPRKPVVIVVPLSYAVLETLLTYQVSRFVQDPMFSYIGTGPEDYLGAALLERVIELQVRRNKIALAMHTMWRDAYVYGFGVATPRWSEEYGLRSVKRDLSVWSLLGKLVNYGSERVMNREVVFEGNVVDSIDPYSYLPDVNVPISEAQKGEYVGWAVRSNYYAGLSEERDSGGEIFNTRYLKEASGQSEVMAGVRTSREFSAQQFGSATLQARTLDTIWMVVTLIPEEWELGKEEYPEKWLFAVSGDAVVRYAAPQQFEHGMYNVVVCAPDADGHSIFPTAKLEISYGLQKTVDFFMNSRMANVRKALNDMFVADPMRINIQDMLQPKPGKIIRLRKSAWGQGVEGAIKQFPVNDVTANHMNDISALADLLNRVTGATDIIQGVMRQGGERRSALEARDARAAAVSRLAKGAQIGAMQAHWDMQLMLASHTQQFMSRDLPVRATGRLAEYMAREYKVDPATVGVSVSPEDLRINYDVMPSNYGGSGEGDPSLWLQQVQFAAANPELAQTIDITRMFLHGVRLAGGPSVQDFLRNGGAVNVSVQPDQQVEAQAQRGNVVPVGEYNGAG